jgi:hypothetical protein
MGSASITLIEVSALHVFLNKKLGRSEAIHGAKRYNLDTWQRGILTRSTLISRRGRRTEKPLMTPVISSLPGFRKNQNSSKCQTMPFFEVVLEDTKFRD